jgi:hypothetical protein
MRTPAKPNQLGYNIHQPRFEEQHMQLLLQQPTPQPCSTQHAHVATFVAEKGMSPTVEIINRQPMTGKFITLSAVLDR